MTAPRFEVVRTDAAQPWHARFRAANGRVLFSTENYSRKRGAVNAIAAIARAMHGRLLHDGAYVGVGLSRIEVRYLDLRTPRAGTAAGGKGE